MKVWFYCLPPTPFDMHPAEASAANSGTVAQKASGSGSGVASRCIVPRLYGVAVTFRQYSLTKSDLVVC